MSPLNPFNKKAPEDKKFTNKTVRRPLGAGPPHWNGYTIVVLDSGAEHLPDTKSYLVGYEIIEYEATPPEKLHHRIKKATILVVNDMELEARYLTAEAAPSLRLVISLKGVGEEVGRVSEERGVVVFDRKRGEAHKALAISEHAIALYFALRRRVLPAHRNVQGELGPWNSWEHSMCVKYDDDGERRRPPLTVSAETVGIVGRNFASFRVAQLARKLGMEVMWASFDENDQYPGSILPLKEVLKRSSVVFIISTPESEDLPELIRLKELRSMPRYAVLIEISSGGVTNEEALRDALVNQWISGAAVSKFGDSEGASCLMAQDNRALNLLTTGCAAIVAHFPVERKIARIAQIIHYWSSFNVKPPCKVNWSRVS